MKTVCLQTSYPETKINQGNMKITSWSGDYKANNFLHDIFQITIKCVKLGVRVVQLYPQLHPITLLLNILFQQFDVLVHSIDFVCY